MSKWKYFKEPFLDEEIDSQETEHRFWDDRLLNRLVELGDKEFVKEAKRFRNKVVFWYA